MCFLTQLASLADRRRLGEFLDHYSEERSNQRNSADALACHALAKMRKRRATRPRR